MGNRVRPSWPMPCLNARTKSESFQVPAPNSGSGEMFGATIRLGSGKPISAAGKTLPPPSVPARALGGRWVKSYSEWQKVHCASPCTRYLPRASRSGVRGIVSISSTEAAWALITGFSKCLPKAIQLQPNNNPADTQIRIHCDFCDMHAPHWPDSHGPVACDKRYGGSISEDRLKPTKTMA